jgi:hypothetical protein
MEKESPIFSKSYDLIQWISQHVEKYPKSERFRLARRIEDHAFDFYENLLGGVICQDTRESLKKADLHLQSLKMYLRLSLERKYMSMGQYEHISSMVSEVGRLLGGWQRSHKRG